MMVPSSEGIYRDVVEKTRLGQDKELVYLIAQNQNADSPLRQEVDQLIRDLTLVEFKVAQEIGQSVGDFAPDTLSKELKLPPAGDDQMQRRLSTEIRNLTSGECASTSKGTPSTPAVAKLSNFRVNSTVTNLENQDYTPVPYEKAPKGTIKKTLNRYKAKLQKPDMDRQSRTVSSQTIKAARRSSLVGEALPDYIRKQLTLGDSESNERRSDSTNESRRKSPAKRDRTESLTTPEDHSHIQSSSSRRLENSQNDRFRNVLVNSSSLYVRKEDSSGNNSQEGLDSGISVTDNEYISPGSFTRSVEGSNDQDVLLYNYGNDNDEEDEDEDEENDEHEDDENYLFKK